MPRACLAPPRAGPAMSGSLEVITGCMFSGKTGEMIRRLERAAGAGQGVACYKPAADTRFGAARAMTHNGRSHPAAPVAAGAKAVADLPNAQWREAAVVAFDEANLLGEGLVGVCTGLVAAGRRVVVSGLDLDFRGEPFAPIPALMTQAKDTVRLTAVCTVCGQDATHTQRLVEGRPASRRDPILMVGGKEAYEARCASHHEVAP